MVSFTAAVMKPVRLIILVQKLQAHQDVGHATKCESQSSHKNTWRISEEKKKNERDGKLSVIFFYILLYVTI